MNHELSGEHMATLAGKRTIGGVLAILISTALVGASLQAAGAQEPGDAPELEQMGEYPAADFVDDAAALPPELVDALERDVQLTGAEYLAQSEAALQAVDVVDSLEAAGVEVLGSSIDDTTLVVNVASESDIAIVESTGAVAEIGAPEEFVLPEGLEPKLAGDVYDGQGYYWDDGVSGYRCSVGFNGYLVSNGAKQFATAGHCTVDMAGISGQVKAVSTAVLPNADITSASQLSNIGLPVAGTTSFGTAPADAGYDVGRVAVSDPSAVPKASVLTWGGGFGSALSSTPRTVTGKAAAITGSTLCKSGARTGWRCGPVVDVDESVQIGTGGPVVNSIIAQVCSLPGDSGGSSVVGTAAVGINSWTTLDIGAGGVCPSGTNFYAGSFPMVSAAGGASLTAKYTTTWELATTPPVPGISSVTNTTITGTLASATAPNTVSVYIDGSPTALATVDASSGSWSVSIASVPNGLHTFTAVANYGQFSKGAPANGTIKKNMDAARLAGPDRYSTGIAVSTYAFGASPSSVPVLFVTTGMNYPDALSAGPAAVHLGGPLMLVQPDSLTTAVRDQIIAFNPERVVVLGSDASVSENVFDQIVTAVPSADVERQTGPDRYSTSRLVTREAFLNDTDPGGATHVFISNGGNFPDALSAGAAAATVDGPVILVNGVDSSVPAATIDLLDDLGVTTIYIAGSANSVSQGIMDQLDAEFPSATLYRLAGSSRYETSQVINSAFFSPTETQAFIATGENYPDALAGSAAAGKLGVPLYITNQSCVQVGTFAELVRLKTTKVRLLGAAGSLSDNVLALNRC